MSTFDFFLSANKTKSTAGTSTPSTKHLAFVIILFTGIAFWLPVRNFKNDLRLRDGFFVVVLFWVGLGITGSIPLLLSTTPNLSVTNAIFESISGLTTTGATIITEIDNLPKSILFYRQELQWLGGMGIIVLAVAILPMLGIGGMQLYRAETPGPVKDTKLTPRITETAKSLWYIYLTMTIACAFSYYLAGMNSFDAIAHSFSTVSIGGFSTHDQSIGYFNNGWMAAVAPASAAATRPSANGKNASLQTALPRRSSAASPAFQTAMRLESTRLIWPAPTPSVRSGPQ